MVHIDIYPEANNLSNKNNNRMENIPVSAKGDDCRQWGAGVWV